jgi:pimeloyl-ACP methyl ester carboxylesterase
VCDPKHRFIQANGIRIHIAELGDGPLVLLCHGFPETWYSWRHQLRALADAGYHAVAPDMRGSGQTDRPGSIDQYTLFHLVGDMVGLLDVLGEQTAVIVGHDWGAPVAWHAALLRADRFRGVVALSVPYPYPVGGPVRPTSIMPQTDDAVFYQLYHQTPGVADAEFADDVRGFIRRSVFTMSADGPMRTRLPGAGPVGMVPRVGGLRARWSTYDVPQTLPLWCSETDVEVVATEFARTGFTGGLNYYRNIDRNWELLAPFVGAKIVVPALYMVGQYDITLAFEGIGQLIEKLPNIVPRLSQTITLPNCGHWTQQEQPETVNAALLQFLHAL